MQTTTRRTALATLAGTLAAGAALTGPALAAQPDVLDFDALVRRLDELEAFREPLEQVLAETNSEFVSETRRVRNKYLPLLRVTPADEPLWRRATPPRYPESWPFWEEWQVDELAAGPTCNDAERARLAELRAHHDRLNQENDAIEVRLMRKEAQDRIEPTFEEMDKIHRAVMAAPITSPKAIAAKARVILDVTHSDYNETENDYDYGPQMARALARQLIESAAIV